MKKDNDLDELRARIDSLDTAMVKMLDERAELIQEIGRRKKKDRFGVYDPARERKIIDRLAGEEKRTGFPAQGIKEVFEEIFTHSRMLQEPLKVAFLGPPTTFTHMAALKKFGNQATLISRDSIREVFNAVERHEVEYGVVPVENSTEGSVNNTLDRFLYSKLKIVAELFLNVRHHLIAKGPLEEITRVYSRRIALAQCKDWIFNNIPGVELMETSSTASGAMRAAQEPHTAAIASELASKANKLNIVARNIEDNPNNITRFLVIGKVIPKKTGRDKTSIMFSVKHQAGHLLKALKPLHDLGINMTNIESRPTPMQAWEYVFFVDMEGFIEDPPIVQALDKLNDICPFVAVLGSYPIE